MAAAFFSELSLQSRFGADAFHKPGRPELGPYHSENTFRSPFAVDRTKASWHFRAPVRLSPERVTRSESAGLTTLSFLASSETLQRADALQTVRLLTRRSVRSARIELVPLSGVGGTTLQSFFSEDGAKIVNHVMRRPCDGLASPPWFYTAKDNVFFPITWLRQAGFALRHIFVLKDGANDAESAAADDDEAECWATVAWVRDEERSQIKFFSAADLFVPEVTSVASGEHGEAAIGPERAVNEGAVVAFAWRTRPEGEHSDRVSVWCRSPSGPVFVLRDFPTKLCPRVEKGDAGWRVWETSASPDIWPPPGIGLDSRGASCPGAEHFILSVTRSGGGPPEVEFAVVKMRILRLGSDGAVSFG